MNKINKIKTLAGVEMPQLIYGTAWKKERTTDLVVQAVVQGFNGIDTACQPRHYREDLVGEAVAQLNQRHGVKREDLYIQTKFTAVDGQDPDSIPYDPTAPLKEQVKQSFAQTQKNLGTDYVDSLVLHSPLNTLEALMEVWTAMEEIYEAGGAGQIGISNCYYQNVMELLWTNAKVKPAVLQNRFSPETGYDRDLRTWCNENGVKTQTFWTLTANPHILNHSTMKDISAKHGKTAPQIFFRYLTQRGISPLTGTCDKTHMSEDLQIFSFDIDEDDIEAINGLLYS